MTTSARELTEVDVVVIDDEASIRDGCKQTLEAEGYHAVLASDGEEGLEAVARERPQVVLLDLRMPGISGVEVLEKLPGIDPRIVPIIITGYGSVDSAVTSMKLGAFDFLSKPFDPDQLLGIVEQGFRAYQQRQLEQTSAPESPMDEPAGALGATIAAPIPLAALPADAAWEAEAEEGESPSEPRPTESDYLLRGLEALVGFGEAGLESHTLAGRLAALECEAVQYARRLGRVRRRKDALAALLADLRLVDEVVAKHGHDKAELIQIMMDIQRWKRWLPRHVLWWVAARLNVTLARVYAIASFYNTFSLEPRGKHTVEVCRGTACHVRRAPALSSMVSEVLGIEPGQTDSEQQFTFQEVHCLGCCALAPVLKVDGETYANPTLGQLRHIVEQCEADDKEQV